MRYLREFYQFGIGPVYDILLMRHCLAVWEIRGRVSKKKKKLQQHLLRVSDIPMPGVLIS